MTPMPRLVEVFDVLPSPSLLATVSTWLTGWLTAALGYFADACLVMALLFIVWTILTSVFSRVERQSPEETREALEIRARLRAQWEATRAAYVDSGSNSDSDSNTNSSPVETVLMSPLEVDLSRVETMVDTSLPALPALPTAPAASSEPSAFPLYTAPSSLPPASGSVAVLDAHNAHDDSDDDGDDDVDDDKAHDDDDHWPPPPTVRGARTYRFILVSGQLVRLDGLRRFAVYPLHYSTFN